jgi:glycosyltransferase involved in cell wall biosynthesis
MTKLKASILESEKMEASSDLSISIVIPVFNEEENLKLLQERLTVSLSKLGLDYEVIYVDDGSTDASFDLLQNAAEDDNSVKVVQLSRNFGQTAAIAAGVDHAQGKMVVLMDADLQNDPADIPAVLSKLQEGYDLVSGWRINRQDPWLTRRLPSRIANALISWVTGVPLHDYGCTLKAYRQEIFSGFRLYGEMHRFLPAYAAQVGARIAEVPVTHHPRRYGKSKYNLKRTIKVVLDLLTVKFLSSYASKPIYLFGSLGLLLIGSSLAILVYLVLDKLLQQRSLIESPLLLMTVMLFILGFLSVFMGLMTELLIRTYHESQNKPTYVVRQVIHRREQS